MKDGMNVWRDIVADFSQQFIKVPVYIVGNSIGSLAGLLVTFSFQCYDGCLAGLPNSKRKGRRNGNAQQCWRERTSITGNVTNNP